MERFDEKSNFQFKDIRTPEVGDKGPLNRPYGFNVGDATEWVTDAVGAEKIFPEEFNAAITEVSDPTDPTGKKTKIVVDPTKVTPAFTFADIISKEDASKINRVFSGTEVDSNGNATPVSLPEKYEDKIKVLDTINPKFLYPADTNKRAINVDQLLGFYNESRIAQLRKEEMKRERKSIVQKTINTLGLYTPDNVETEIEKPIFDSSQRTRANKANKALRYYKSLKDSKGNKLTNKDITVLLNLEILGRGQAESGVVGTLQDIYNIAGPEWGTTFSTVRGVTRKATELLKDVPRSLVDFFFITTPGVVGEYGYKALKFATDTFGYEIDPIKTTGESLYYGDGRDLVRKYLGDDAATAWQKDLLQLGGTHISKELAEKTLYYNFDIIERFATIAPSFFSEVKTFMAGTVRKADNLMAKLEKHKAENPQLSDDADTLYKTFIDRETSKSAFNIFRQGSVLPKKIREIIIQDRLKRGVELQDTKKLASERVGVQIFKNAEEKAQNNLNKYVQDYVKKYKINNIKDIPNDPEYNALRAKYLKAKIERGMAELTTNTPPFVKEFYKDAGMYSLLGATGGQAFQELGYDQRIGTLLGFGTGLTAQLTYGGYKTFMGDNGIMGNLDPSKHTLFLTYISAAERQANGFKSKDDIIKALKNPAFEGLPEDVKPFALEISKKLAILDPDIVDDFAANTLYYTEFKNNLVKAGIDPKNVTETLGSIKGFALFNSIQDAFLVNIDYNDVFDPDVVKHFKQLQDKNLLLQNDIKEKLKTILGTKNLDKSNPAIVELQTSVTNVLKQLEDRQSIVKQLQRSMFQTKVKLLQDISTGSVDPTDTKLLLEQYGSINAFYSSLLDEASELNFIQAGKSFTEDVASGVQFKKEIDTLESLVMSSINHNMTALQTHIKQNLNNIPDIRAKETITSNILLTGKSGTALATLNKLSNEDSSFAKSAQVAMTSNKKKASQPFKEFEALYGEHFTDATDIAFEFLDKIRGNERFSKQLIKQSFTKQEDNIIFEIFDTGASDWLKQQGYVGEKRTALIEEMIDQGYDTANQGSNIRSIDILNWMRKDPEWGSESIGIGLNLKNTIRFLDWAKSRAARSDGTPQSVEYYEFASKVQGLFDEVRNQSGDIIEEGSELFAQIKTMKTNYLGMVIQPYKNSGQDSTMWANPKFNAAEDNNDYPGMKYWGDKKKPETWLTMDDLLTSTPEFGVSKLDNFNLNLIRTFGKYSAQYDKSGRMISSTRIIDPNGPFGNMLRNHSRIKYLKGVFTLHEQVQNGKLKPEDLDGKIELLENNLRKAYGISRKGEGGNNNAVTSIFNAAEAGDSFGLDIRTITDTNVAKKVDEVFKKINQKAISDEVAYINKIQQKDRDIREIFNADKSLSTNASAFNYFFVSSSGSTNLRRVKNLVVGQGKMTEQRFNEAIKEVAGEHLDQMIMKDTGKTVVKIFKDPNGTKVQQNIKIVDTDLDTLGDILDNTVLMNNLKDAGVVTEDSVKHLKTIRTLLARQRAKDKANVGFSGRPSGLSIESYISRFYSVNRGVVSFRYVGTEALIQSIRKNKHLVLQRMFTDPDVAEAIADLVSTVGPMSKAKVKSIDAILYTLAVESQQFTNREVKKSEKLKTDAPAILSMQEALQKRI